jgi:hypothetical protein
VQFIDNAVSNSAATPNHESSFSSYTIQCVSPSKKLVCVYYVFHTLYIKVNLSRQLDTDTKATEERLEGAQGNLKIQEE